MDAPNFSDPNNPIFPSGPTGSGLASFLLGYSSDFARYFTGEGFHPGLRQTRLFFYVQDSWRVTQKLTLNIGLRYENYLPRLRLVQVVPEALIPIPATYWWPV